jgi:hypothetical protein
VLLIYRNRQTVDVDRLRTLSEYENEEGVRQ